MSDYMADLNGVLMDQTVQSVTAKNSTNRKAGTELDMTDFLTLMVAMFQNQSIDDVASTSDMMNQMVQMSVINAVTNMNSLLSESTSLTYAASLVGKEVTIGQYVDGELTELVGTVTGTGTLDGRQVVFIGDDSYWLTDVMAVGRLPEREITLLDENTEEALYQNGTDRTPVPTETEDEYEGTNGLDVNPVEGADAAAASEQDASAQVGASGATDNQNDGQSGDEEENAYQGNS